MINDLFEVKRTGQCTTCGRFPMEKAIHVFVPIYFCPNDNTAGGWGAWTLLLTGFTGYLYIYKDNYFFFAIWRYIWSLINVQADTNQR